MEGVERSEWNRQIQEFGTAVEKVGDEIRLALRLDRLAESPLAWGLLSILLFGIFLCNLWQWVGK